MKTCRKCRQELPEICFSKMALSPDGLARRCRSCLSDDRRSSKARHPDRHEQYKAKRRLYHASRLTKEFRDKINRQVRQRYWKNRNAARNRQLRTEYGITLADREAMFAAQGGVCAICHRAEGHEPWEKLHVDHCHASGKVRGLLCRKCNMGIGGLEDSLELLQRAMEYLKPHLTGKAASDNMGPAT